MATTINQGVKISTLPSVTSLDPGDNFLVSESTGKAGQYNTKKIDAAYITSLRTSAANLGSSTTGSGFVYQGFTGGTGKNEKILKFRKLVQKDNVKITQTTDEIQIAADLSKCVIKDANNNFTAGTITATLNGYATGLQSSGKSYGVGSTGNMSTNSAGGGGYYEQKARTSSSGSSSGNAAYISFHRPNSYGVKFGLDTDNQLKVGGWSMGNVSYPILHTGNINQHASIIKEVAKAKALTTPRKINGVSFDGTKDIGLPLTVGVQDFRDQHNLNYHGTGYRISSFLGTDGRVYIAGNCSYGGGIGVGWGVTQVRGGFLALDTFRDFKISKYYMGYYNMWGLTNGNDLYHLGGYNGYYQRANGNTDGSIRRDHIANDIKFFTTSNAASNGYTTQFYIDSGNRLNGWGYNGHGQLGIGNTTSAITTPRSINVGGGRYIKKVWSIGDSASSYGYSFALDTTGELWAAGYNGYGQLGVGNTIQQTTWVSTTLPSYVNVVDVASCMYNSVGFTLVLDDEGNVWSTGYGGYYQHGDNSTSNRNSFTKISGLSKITKIYCSGLYGWHCAAINENEEGYVWGRNYYGAFGLKTSNQITRPTRIKDASDNVLSNIKKIVFHAVSANYMAVLTTNGHVYTAGYSGYGQTARGDSTYNDLWRSHVPRDQVSSFKGFVDIDAWGEDVGSGLLGYDADGNLYACGWNAYGATGQPYPERNVQATWMRSIIL